MRIKHALVTAGAAASLLGASIGCGATPTTRSDVGAGQVNAAPTEIESAPSASTPPPSASVAALQPSASATPVPPPMDPADALPALASLPAVAESGKVVAMFTMVSDHACGVPTYIFIDVKTDKATITPLIDVECTKPLPDRLAAVQKALDAEKWITLKSLSMDEDPAAPAVGSLPPPRIGTDARTRVRFTEPKLTITVDGKDVLARSFPAWSGKPGKACPTCQMCPAATPMLERVLTDEAKRVALVEIDYYGGTDMCWEPDPIFHAFAY